MANEAVFLGRADVSVAAAGALGGDGQVGNPLQVEVDGTTIEINGSNELEVIASGLNANIPSASTSTITLGEVTGTTQEVVLQANTASGAACMTRQGFTLYFSDSATGDPVGCPGDFASVEAGDGDAWIPSSSAFEPDYTGVVFYGKTNMSGVFSFTIDNAGAEGTFALRLVVMCPDGVLIGAPFNIPNGD